MLLRFLRHRSGATAIEFAIVGSVFIVLVLGIVEFGRVFYMRGKLSFAADTGARLVLMTSNKINDQTATLAEITTAVKTAFGTEEETEDLTVVVASEQLDGVDYRTLSLTYPMKLMIPGFSEQFNITQFRRTPML